jgi:hypothetical protein
MTAVMRRFDCERSAMTIDSSVDREPDKASQRVEVVGKDAQPPTSTANTDPMPGWWKIHIWPVAGTVALLLGGMAYSLFWYPVVNHVSYWVTPSDLWGTFRDAHYVIWNGEGQVYNASTNFVTFPGIAVLLAPLAWLQEGLKLSVSWPVYLSKPTGWFVLGPVNLLCGAVLLFPLDAISRRLSLSSIRRALSMLCATILIFPDAAFWGHPEDTLALALGLYALLAAYDRRWLHSAAFFALAVVFQPLILLIVPIALAYVPFKKWPAFGIVLALPTTLLLLPPLIQQWGPTTYAIFKQPNYPTIDHATPWLSLAPVLTKARWVYALKIHYSPEKHKFIYGPVKTWVGESVSAGPGRTIAILLACLIGVWVAHKKPTLAEVIWWAAFALALRCVFESVMDPYYAIPALVLAVIVAFTVGKFRLVLTLVGAAICTRTSYWHTGEWRYYLFVTLPLLAAVVLSWPGRKKTKAGEVDAPSSELTEVAI